MNNNNLHGWKNVFLFTFKEEIKQKSYLIMLAAFFALAIASMPLVTIISETAEKHEVTSTEITSITVYDETGLQIDYDDFAKKDKYKDVDIYDEPQEVYEEKINELKADEGSKDIVVKISFDEEGYYQMTVTSSPKCNLSDYDISDTSEDFREYFDKARLQKLQVTEEQVLYMMETVDMEVIYISDNAQILDGEQGLSVNEYSFVYALLMIVTLIISFSGQKLATSIITEKSTRVIEYLAINVKPLALLIGKLFATLSLILLQALGIVVGLVLSIILNKIINGSKASGLSDTVSGVLDILDGLSVPAIFLMVLIIFVGVVFYNLLAGLAGSTVSKLEELNDGMTLFATVTIFGAYMGIALLSAESSGNTFEPLMYVCTFFPLSAPFVVPGYLLMGRISIFVAIISLLLMVVTTVFMFKLTAKIFILTIMYQGNRLKVKDLIRLIKNKPLEREGM